MTAKKASYNSKSFACDASLLLPVSGPSRGRLHESSAPAADASSTTPLIVLETNSSLQSNAGAGITSNPGKSSLRLGRAVMQSCWIQRFNLACQMIDSEEEELTEPSHVWTHFTKDFSSSSRRFHQACSSSWPANERPPKFSPFLHRKLIGPVDVKEHYRLSRATSPMFREEIVCASLDDATESNEFCSSAGNLFSNQNSSHKFKLSTLEALVPCSQHRDEGESSDVGKLQGFTAQHFQQVSKDSEKVTSAVGVDFNLIRKPFLQPDFSRENGSLQEAVSLRVLGDAPCNGNFDASKSAHRIVHIRGSSPDAVMETSLSPALMGAGADADDRILLSPSLAKDVNPSTPLADLSTFSNDRLSKAPSIVNCEASVPAVVFGETEKKNSQTELGVFYRNKSGIAHDMEVRIRRNFGFLHIGGQAKASNQSTANPCVFSGSFSGVLSDRSCVGNRDSDVLTAFKLIQRKVGAGASSFATNAGPFVSKHYINSRSFNRDLWGSDWIISDHAPDPKEEFASKRPLTRASSGNFTRPDDQWVQIFEDPGPAKPLDTGSSTASLPQRHITEQFHKHHLDLVANTLKIDGEEKLKYFSHPSSHIPLKTNTHSYHSCDGPQQAQVSLRESLTQAKQTALGHNQGGSADRSLLEGSIMLRKLQEERLHLSKGEMGRLASQFDKKDLNFQQGSSRNATTNVSSLFGHQSYKFCHDGRTGEASRPNKAWIQRWRSSSNLIAMSGNTLSPSLGTGGDLSSDLAKIPVISSYGGKKGINCCIGNPTEPGRKSSKHMEGLANSDYGSGSTPRGGSTPKGSFPAYRGKYMAPSAEAMAIVGNTTSKLCTTSLQNKGSFSVWPCFGAEKLKQRRPMKHAKETAEDNMHGVDMDES